MSAGWALVLSLSGFGVIMAVIFIPLLYFPLVIITHSLVMYNGKKSYTCSIFWGLITYDVYHNDYTGKWVYLNSGRVAWDNHDTRLDDALKHYKYKTTTGDET